MPVDVEARVIRNTRLSPDYNVIALAAPEIAAVTRPGQFVMVRPARGLDPLLRRPFSVFEILRDEDRPIGITILSKRIGPTTRLLFEAAEGDTISCLGPLGQPFALPEPDAEAWMIAGGVGLAPFATLAESLAARGIRSTLFYGARRADELFYLSWFEQRGVRLVLSTEDGSAGAHGRITVPLAAAFQAADGARVACYACGPEPMLAAVSQLAAGFGRDVQVSVERVMGCGMGGCYSCVVPMKTPDGGHHYVRSCISGPVFAGSSLVWD
ncbi:MAG: dihydroorotate dehydrogenase electron transfer subunit [Acidobacteria bacterium]|nr:dihydroorotate dehydrogenase electron transfer subunit [Acidobacteriota bacterium]